MKRVCHYCNSVRKTRRFGALKGTFHPHSVMTGVAKRRVLSRDVEPSLRDRGEYTEIQSGIWKVCQGSDRRPWAQEYGIPTCGGCGYDGPDMEGHLTGPDCLA